MKHRMSSVIAGLALLVATAGTVEAGGVRVLGGGGTPWQGQTWHGHSHPRPRVVDTPPAQVVLPRHPIVRPVPVYPYPGYIYTAPSYGQSAPGYWSYVWVPQATTSSVWVPGYYDRDGVWVAGYHASQTVQGGYYQPYWVGGSGSP